MGTSSIIQRASRKNLYFRIFDPATGREFRESAHTRDRRVAEIRLAEIEKLVALGLYRPSHERRREHARRAISMHLGIATFLAEMMANGHSKAYVDTTAYLLFNFLEFFEQCSPCEPHLAPNVLASCRLRTAKRKRTAQDEALQLLEPRSTDRPVRALTTGLAEAFKLYRLTVAKADATTVNNELKVLRIFGRWLHDRDYHPGSPLSPVRDVVDSGRAAGRSLSLSEFDSLVCAAQSALKLWTIVTATHGLRRGESDTLRPEDINTDDGYLHIRVHNDREGTVLWRPKFGRERLVPIVERLVPLMKRVRDLPTDEYGRVFGCHDRRKAMKRALTASAVTGHVRFHDLRHTAYTHLKSALLVETHEQVALGEIRLIFGHADATMDRVYDHRTVERLRAVAGRSPLPQAALAAYEKTAF